MALSEIRTAPIRSGPVPVWPAVAALSSPGEQRRPVSENFTLVASCSSAPAHAGLEMLGAGTLGLAAFSRRKAKV